jgi:RNA polymerase sigma-70 factor (ECF subfamily)
MMSELELNEIINSCRERNRASQGRLYNLFYNYAMTVARRYVGASHEAEEVVNDAFFKVFTKLDLYGGELSFKSWFRKIIVNTAIDRIRAQQRLPKLQELDYTAADAPMEAELLATMTKQQILNSVEKLPPAYRTVFNMYVVDECSHEEISQMLGISVGGSKSNLSRARQILKSIFEHEEFLK